MFTLWDVACSLGLKTSGTIQHVSVWPMQSPDHGQAWSRTEQAAQARIVPGTLWIMMHQRSNCALAW